LEVTYDLFDFDISSLQTLFEVTRSSWGGGNESSAASDGDEDGLRELHDEE
jgi:hypothetical protein